MIRDTISKIEARLQSANACSADARAELLQLLGELKREIGTVDEEQARTIAGHTEHLTAQAIGEESERNPESLKRGLQELGESVEGFETSHPKLVAVVNRIATTLANIGI
jgi:hypothetical protein